MLKVSNIISVTLSNSYNLNSSYEDFILKNKAEQVKQLYDAYINSNINEIEKIDRFTIQNKLFNLKEARLKVISYIKKLPINEWGNYIDLKKYIRIFDYEFLRPITGNIMIPEGGGWWQRAGHLECESKFVDRIVCNYLLAMGIVDIKYKKNRVQGYDRYYEYEDYISNDIEYIRLTKLGAYILGIINSYEIKEDKNKIEVIVTSDFNVIVENTSKQLVHEMYFDNFLDGKKLGDTVIYNLNFMGLARALDQSISVQEVIEYLKEYSKNTIPENVLEKLEYWKSLSYMVSIENVSILRCSDKIYNEILSDSKKKKYVEKELSNAIILKENKVDKVKAEFEKNELFCKKW